MKGKNKFNQFSVLFLLAVMSCSLNMHSKTMEKLEKKIEEVDDDVDKKSALKIELNKLRDKARDSEGEKQTNFLGSENNVRK